MAELRLAELVTALSLATDLGMGQPMEHALRTCLLSQRLGEALGLGPARLHDVYYVALLRFLGCTADAHETAAAVGGTRSRSAPPLRRCWAGRRWTSSYESAGGLGRGRGALSRARAAGGFLVNARRIFGGVAAHCELAENLARRLGLGPAVRRGLAHALERWDGGGLPAGVSGEAIELPARIVTLARDLEVLHRLGPPEEVRAVVRRRQGSAYDPAVVAAFERCRAGLAEDLGEGSVWERVLAAEPEPRARVGQSGLDGVLEVFADFVDLKSPYMTGHSRGVAALALGAAPRPAWTLPGRRRCAGRRWCTTWDGWGCPTGCGTSPARSRTPSGSGCACTAITPSASWPARRPWPPWGPLAGLHHERLDGSGYHRGGAAAALPRAARLLAVADAYQAMTQPRPYRPARTPDEAAAEIGAEVAAGGSTPPRPGPCSTPPGSGGRSPGAPGRPG